MQDSEISFIVDQHGNKQFAVVPINLYYELIKKDLTGKLVLGEQEKQATIEPTTRSYSTISTIEKTQLTESQIDETNKEVLENRAIEIKEHQELQTHLNITSKTDEPTKALKTPIDLVEQNNQSFHLSQNERADEDLKLLDSDQNTETLEHPQDDQTKEANKHSQNEQNNEDLDNFQNDQNNEDLEKQSKEQLEEVALDQRNSSTTRSYHVRKRSRYNPLTPEFLKEKFAIYQQQIPKDAELFFYATKNILAWGYPVGSKRNPTFVVLASSTISDSTVDSLRIKAKNCRDQLIEDQLLVLDENAYRLVKNYEFHSPSLAACIVSGNNRSGGDAWKNIDGISLKNLGYSDRT